MKWAYRVITDQIIEILEQGAVPWHRPWGGPGFIPRNLVSGKHYRGVNKLILSAADFDEPFWLTEKQALDRGGTLLKGEIGFPCIYANHMNRIDKSTGKKRRKPFIKHYTVFNVEQCTGVEYPEIKPLPKNLPRYPQCERIIKSMPNPPMILHEGSSSLYLPEADIIWMPKMDHFDTSEDYYDLLFHELVHSTGQEKRLNRQEFMKSYYANGHYYGKEELVAEIGSMFLCGKAGIERKVIDNSSAYINGWLKRIEEDKGLVIHSASLAQKAADYILDDSKFPF